MANLQIPDNACAYEEYDPTTLKPVNQSTCIRLQELGWTQDDFSGKSVLDIGCNSGILSLYANKLGAESVRAVDVQAPFIEFFTSVVETHALPINVEQTGFNDLSADTHASDVVLFMEVLHWIIDQKGTIEDAIYKVASLAKETLFLETPWDTNEPSIAKRGHIQADQYNIELIIKELLRYFENVEVVRFMSYFGAMENSKRLLIKASDRRADFESLQVLRDVNPLNISMGRGSNSIQLMTSPHGPVVLKKLPKESMLPLLNEKHANAFFELLEHANGPLLPAIKINGTYIFKNKENEQLMLSPFVGDLSNHLLNHTFHLPVGNPLRLAVECRRTLKEVPNDVINAIKEKSAPIGLRSRDDLGIFFNHLLDNQGLSEFIDDVFQASVEPNRDIEDSVIHNDLQLGNMITDTHGKDWIIDLDILRSGSAYSDFICCAIYNNTPKDIVIELYREMADINGRSIHHDDMYFALRFILKWISILNEHHKPVLAKFGEPTVNGIKTLYDIVMTENAEQKLAS